MLGDCVEYGWTNSYSVVASDLHYEPHLWLVGFPASMRSAVVLISSSVVDVRSWLSTLLESQFWNLSSGSVKIRGIVNVLYAPDKPPLPKNCVWPSLKCHTSQSR